MEYSFSELEELININSYTKNKAGVDKNGEIVRIKLESLGYVTTVFEREHIGNHLWFKSPKKEGEKILLLGHLDTVFPPGTFEYFREDEEWIYGPGVCDMKGGIMVMIEALRRQKELFNVDIFLVSDEETGSDDSSELTFNIAKEYDYCLVFEAAGKNGEVVTQRKGIGTFEIEIKGKAAHAGNCFKDGIDANQEAAHKILALSHLSDPDNGTTVNVGKIEGGIGANTISPMATLLFETRFTSASERDRVLASMTEITNTSFIPGTTATLGGRLQRDVMEERPEQLAFLERIKQWTGIKLPVEHRGGGSDANIAASAGTVTLDGFGPYGDGDHTIHERASKKSFIQRIELTTSLLKGFMQESKKEA
ncbi:M20 family metallopeptidase [Nitratiruptor tergarcus]|uniref:Glutamate carboxypeptidase n=1 Tax=Nitratiruptor tergarcus DSM 16512 TaxID=1069081 RepID=A0A1W1WVG2_9BACT|nr:M20 family metallopeptidase [Nitratiruptor tergarcus]SMC09723.1 glutamate carboxypeptidase [Nitratiruptor tergarcus DSM 16512]